MCHGSFGFLQTAGALGITAISPCVQNTRRTRFFESCVSKIKALTESTLRFQSHRPNLRFLGWLELQRAWSQTRAMALQLRSFEKVRLVALALGLSVLPSISACSHEHVDSPQEHALKVQQNRKSAALVAGEKRDIAAALGIANAASGEAVFKGYRIEGNFVLYVTCDADAWNTLSVQDQDIVFQNLLSTWHNIRRSRVPGSPIGLTLVDLANNELKSNGMFNQ
jgi:hypothetical protein